MHLSRYLKFWPADDLPGYTLLYSTRRASLALIPDEAMAELQKDRCPPAYADQLAELDMLVPDPEKERASVHDFLNEINRLNPNIDISVILGLACNFSCVYCYEGSLKGKAAMSEQTADQLTAFIKQRLRPGKERITLAFYGGEPLLYPARIKQIAGNLQGVAAQHGVKFRFSLVTNGALLTPTLVKELLPFGLYGAKVTVDGPAQVHNQTRPFKNGAPSFDLILKNLRDCADLMDIGLGGNFTRHNYHRFPQLFDDLAAHGLTPQRLGSIQFGPVSQSGDRYANPEFTGGCTTSAEPWVAEAAILLREETLKRGYKTPKIKPSPCMVDVDDGLVVNHDGNLFKCVALIGHAKYRIGDLNHGTTDLKHYHPQRWRDQAECRTCAYLPLCYGGCRDMSFQHTGSMARVECQKTFFDTTLEAIIKQDVKYRHGTSSAPTSPI